MLSFGIHALERDPEPSEVSSILVLSEYSWESEVAIRAGGAEPWGCMEPLGFPDGARRASVFMSFRRYQATPPETENKHTLEKQAGSDLTGRRSGERRHILTEWLLVPRQIPKALVTPGTPLAPRAYVTTTGANATLSRSNAIMLRVRS